MKDDIPPYPEDRDKDLVQKYQVSFKEGLDNFLCVGGIPKVPKARVEKLTEVLKKVFRGFGQFIEDTMTFALDDEGGTKGFVFVEFDGPEESARALKKIDGYQLDRNHVFSATLFSEVFQALATPDEWVPPPKEEFQERENFKYWLLDPNARDQLVTRFLDETAVFWNMKNDPPEPVYNRANWTDTIVQWSPKGSYLATFHRQGIALWGGPTWKKIVRFPHGAVRLIDFSPNENYLTTWSSETMKGEHEGKNIIVWDVRSGKPLRSFETYGQNHLWPIFKWSFDDKYLGRVGEDVISVYHTPDMGLIDKKSIKVDGVKDFSWSPKQNFIAFWTPEIGNSPARVTVMEIPSRNIIRTKNLFSVNDCKFFWQSEGDYLMVKVDRNTKTKKSIFTNFELFRLREKDIPVEVLDLKEEVITTSSWEPKGNHFLTLHGEGPNALVTIYSIEKSIKLIKQLEKKQVNQVIWSPRGQMVIFAALGAPSNGSIEFYHIESMETMATVQHDFCSDIEWDPTGRYLITTVSNWKYATDNGYIIWDFRGKQLHHHIQDKFFQVLWRPRPPTLLSKEKLKEIKKNLKEYSVAFNKQDESKDTKASTAARDRRRRLLEEWNDFMRRVEDEYQQQKGIRFDIRGYASDDEGENETIEEFIEEVLEEHKSLVK